MKWRIKLGCGCTYLIGAQPDLARPMICGVTGTDGKPHGMRSIIMAEDYEQARAARAADRQNWQELADWISAEIDKEYPLHASYVNDGLLAEAAPFGGMLVAYRLTLARVRELAPVPLPVRNPALTATRGAAAGEITSQPAATGSMDRGNTAVTAGQIEQPELGD